MRNYFFSSCLSWHILHVARTNWQHAVSSCQQFANSHTRIFADSHTGKLADSQFTFPSPLIKGIKYQLNPQILSSTTKQPKAKKSRKIPPPLKQSTRNLSLGYTEIEKKQEGAGGGGGGGQDLAMTFCYLWLTEKLWLFGGTDPNPTQPL